MRLLQRTFRTTALLLPLTWCSSVQAQLSIASVGVPVVEDFNIPGTSNCTAALTWQNDATIPACYSDRPTFNYSNGCANIGGLHVAGVGGETALGGRGSNTTTSVRWGVRFKNNTGVTLGQLHISARCEQWGQAQSNLANNVTPFAYRTSSSPITDVTSGTYVNDPTWNLVSFTPPGGCGGGNSAIDGNSATYSALKEGCLNVTLAPGDEIMLRWFDTNDPCNDHMLCVDDLTVTGYEIPSLSMEGGPTFCEGGSVTLTVNGSTDVTWSTGETTSSITVHDGGTYTATCGTGCGNVVLTQELTMIGAPTAAITPTGPLSLCPGTSLDLTATGDGTFLWSTGATTATITVDAADTYSVTVTGACGSADASVVVDASSLPTAHVTPNGTVPFCVGTPVTLTASGGDSYLWSNGESGPTVEADAEGPWTVTASNACGSDAATVDLQVIPLPEVSITSSTGILCPDQEAVLTAEGDGPFAWSTGGTGSSITIASGGTYTATASNTCGSTTASITIEASPLTAGFTADPTSGTAPLTVSFTNTSTSAGAVAWDFDTGTSTDPSPTWTYTEAGMYEVVLTASDPATGCTATASMIIVVTPGTSWITVPNVFTPNGDGNNDAFQVQQEGIIDLDCTLLNRWGQEVGHITAADQGWNGRRDGETLPEGTYYYVLKATGLDGRTYDLNGAVTLTR